MNEEKKYNLIVSIWSTVLIVLQVFTLISNVTMKINILQEVYVKNTVIIVSVAMIILLVLYLLLSLKKSAAGPLIGIMCSILFFFNFNIFNIAIGVGFLITCISMLKDLNKMECANTTRKSLEIIICYIIIVCLIISLGIVYYSRFKKVNNYNNLEKEYEKQIQTENSIKQNIKKEVLGIAKNGDYIIKLTNNNDTPVYISSVDVNFLDKNGYIVDFTHAMDWNFCIPANHEVITYVGGLAYDLDHDAYSKSRIEIYLIQNLNKEVITDNLKIQSKNTGEEIKITIINNNDIDLDDIDIKVIFYKGNKIVGISSGYINPTDEYKIPANGGKAYRYAYFPTDKDYNEIEFDKFEVFFTCAYKN